MNKTKRDDSEMKYFMVGDWVYNTHHKKNMRVTLYDFFTHDHNKDVGQFILSNSKPTMGRDLIPVELTEEILKKNGFAWGNTSDEEDYMSLVGGCFEKGWVFDEGCGSVKVVFPNETDGGMIVLCDQSFDRNMTITFTTTIYVHELQHVLKFMNIDMDIEL